MNKVKKATDKLLTRDQFREAVFARDNNLCVMCEEPAQDAHHILERRLFDDGGYYLSNGASLCGPCHILAEQTAITVEEIRANAGITAPALPSHFYPDERYDKWGNIILPNGTRIKGELFSDPSVQKILQQGEVLKLFSPYVKYPRTFHLPWSPGATSDDRILTDLSEFKDREVVVTLKMDGENTTIYSDYYHARSLDGNSHPSQSWARNFHNRIKQDIPPGWRICAENLYAKHSIGYDNLDSYLLVFSIWNEHNICLSWAETKLYADMLGLKTVPVIWEGLWDESFVQSFCMPEDQEGYVVRVSAPFYFSEFRKMVAKYVRAGHVQTTHHWKSQMIVPNKLKS